ncbi:hypothetical protein Tco_1254400 [Tanacetum coccineum]
MKSIKKYHFKWDRSSDDITRSTEGANQHRSRYTTGHPNSPSSNHYTDANRHLGTCEDDSSEWREFKMSQTITEDLRSQTVITSSQAVPIQSSKSPQPTKEPYPTDNSKLDSGSSSTENLN